jgi:hypothetical protein
MNSANDPNDTFSALAPPVPCFSPPEQPPAAATATATIHTQRETAKMLLILHFIFFYPEKLDPKY